MEGTLDRALGSPVHADDPGPICRRARARRGARASRTGAGGSGAGVASARAATTRRRGDRGVRGSVRTRHDGKTTPAATVPTRVHVQTRRSDLPDVKSGVVPEPRPRERSTHPEPARRGYGYEVVRWQKSVRRIARPHRSKSRKAKSIEAARAEEHSASALTRGAAASRRKRCDKGRVPSFPTRKRARSGSRRRSGSSRHDGRHPDRGAVDPQGATERRSRSRG